MIMYEVKTSREVALYNVNEINSVLDFLHLILGSQIDHRLLQVRKFDETGNLPFTEFETKVIENEIKYPGGAYHIAEFKTELNVLRIGLYVAT